MSSKKTNARNQELERLNKRLQAVLSGSRSARAELMMQHAKSVRQGLDTIKALWRYEGMWFFRLARWVMRRKGPTAILMEKWATESGSAGEEDNPTQEPCQTVANGNKK